MNEATRARRRTSGITLIGNFLGAVLAFLYFRVIDYSASQRDVPITRWELAYFVAGLALLGVLGSIFGFRWGRPLLLVREGVAGPVSETARRRALQFPYMMALLALVGWVLAGVLWGVVWPLLSGTFEVGESVRSVLGITVIGGSVTTAFIFFAVEHDWRQTLPRFFPEGQLSAVRGVIRLPVRWRLLVVFLLVSIVPLCVLGVVAYTRAAASLQADPATARALVGSMLVLIAFIVAVGTVAAAALSLFVARSVAGPLRDLETAMGEVGQGRLDARCPVVTNDEIGRVAEGFNRMVEGLVEHEFLKETFGRYVSREIRDEILAGRITLEGQTLEVTMLFADLRDFTPWVEASAPRDVVRDLNAYFTEMEAAIRLHGGLVVQYIGDEIEAVFGAPVPLPGHAAMAVRAALEMRRRLEAWNTARRAAGAVPLRHGIGIHTGTVLAGNIGSAERHAYALVGDAVNLASRIQGLTKDAGTDVLVSATTRAQLDGAFPLIALPAARVKGKSAEVEVYRLA